jgi:hypothetical protein
MADDVHRDWTRRCCAAERRPVQHRRDHDHVRDSQGGVLPGATVVATHVASGLRSERLSDAGGRAFLPPLLPGDDAVTAALNGFRHGRIFSANPARQMQFGVKLVF